MARETWPNDDSHEPNERLATIPAAGRSSLGKIAHCHRQIDAWASAARALHFASSTPRMMSQPAVTITPTIANSATTVNS